MTEWLRGFIKELIPAEQLHPFIVPSFYFLPHKVDKFFFFPLNFNLKTVFAPTAEIASYILHQVFLIYSLQLLAPLRTHTYTFMQSAVSTFSFCAAAQLSPERNVLDVDLSISVLVELSLYWMMHITLFLSCCVSNIESADTKRGSNQCNFMETTSPSRAKLHLMGH